MSKIGITMVGAACALTLACGGGNRGEEQAAGEGVAGSPATGYEAQAGARPQPVQVTGCLTEAEGRFVLTALDAAEGNSQGAGGGSAAAREGGTGETTTESYQLVGNTEELRQHVNRQVRVNGEAAAPQVAEIRESTPPARADGSTTGSTAGTAGERPREGEPQVRSTTETRMEVTQLRVQSVTATGNACTPPSGRSRP